jgi:hypothetical protein
LIVLTALGVAPATAQAACPTTTTVIDLIEVSESSATAYEAADLQGFIETSSRLDSTLPCVSEPIPRNVAANIHRMMGLRAFVDQKKEKSVGAFGAARAIEPSYRFPETMVPQGHPIMAGYEAMDISAVASKEVRKPAEGYLHFDGRPGSVRSVELPTVAQLFDGEGAVSVTAYLWPSDGMFDYAEASADVVEITKNPAPIAGRRGPNVPLVLSAGGAAVLSGVFYGVAASASGKFNSPATPYEDGPKLRAQTNTFLLASGGVGVAAIGLGIGAVVAGQW